MKVYEDLIQGTDEWLELRKGKATASEFSKILTKMGKLSASKVGLMHTLANEQFDLSDKPQLDTAATRWGHKYEAEARAHFEINTGLITQEVGFCLSDFSEYVGNSPDALIIGEDGEYCGGLEIKCPYVIANHSMYLEAGVVPDIYKLQVHGSMVVSGFDSWHFMSYYPTRTPLIIKVERDEFTDKVEAALKAFATEYAEKRPQIIKAITPE